MGRPKGFVPQACNECGNKGRHKVTCTRSSVGTKLSTVKIVRPYVKREETQEEKSALVEGGLPAIHAYVSYKQDYKCDAEGCKELLELGRQHWTDGNGRHLCIEHAAEVERKRTLTS